MSKASTYRAAHPCAYARNITLHGKVPLCPKHRELKDRNGKVTLISAVLRRGFKTKEPTK